MSQSDFEQAIAVGIPDELPPMPPPVAGVASAPARRQLLSEGEQRLALSNALRYFPQKMHAALAPEFAAELKTDGRIYMRRFRPSEYEMRARPIDEYPARCRAAAAIMLMIQNNLDPAVAQYPHELITYGGNGAVFQNWAQYRLTMKYLSEMTEEQTLVLYSGHPHGLFPSHRDAPRVVVTNGMVIPNYSTPDQYPHELITYGGNGAVFQNWAQYRLTMKYLSEMTDEQTLVLYSGHPHGLFPSHRDAPRVVVTNGMVIPNYSTPDQYERLNALGVSSYGQMTAGSFMYIGPQGIVHGTTITLLNAARKYLGGSGDNPLAGKLYVTSGLGGMSGAQAKAAVIAGAIGVIAEVNPEPLYKRRDQGWLQEVETDLDRVLTRIEQARSEKQPLSLGYLGNVVDLWERLAREGVEIDLGSDQTSLHNPFGGGYYPVGLSCEQSNELLRNDPERFKAEVQSTLRRHVDAINTLAARGMHFWDYGNAFLLEASRAGAQVTAADGSFRYPSYVEDIMGPLCFDYGFGPFRWVCTSATDEDLRVTDRIAAETLERMAADAPPEIECQLRDNLRWIREAEAHQMVVGSRARILYSDEEGRKRIALEFNRAVADGRLSAPVVLGRDHHDVSGTDSPYRETADIRDGSSLCADMAVHNVIGGAFRGATWVSLHNGGGVGWGEVINGGFGMFVDGSEDAARRIEQMIAWDVNNGVARRAWARNGAGIFAIRRAMARDERLVVTLPNEAQAALIDAAIDSDDG